MAGQIKVNQVQLGDSGTAANNFVWQTNADGTCKLARGNAGATTQDILTVGVDGKVTLTGGDNGLGVGQTWQNVTGSRSLGTTYTNTTGKPIYMVVGSATGNIGITVTVGGVSLGQRTDSGSAIIPAGATYSVSFSTGAISSWAELR